MSERTDVVIAGGSVAGCALAALLGRQGVRTTILEKATKPDHYKVVCTHFIQPGALPVLERLGLCGPIEAAGGLRNGPQFWIDVAGWIVPEVEDYGYNIRRQKLDPMLRDLASRTPNVELRTGVTATELLRDDAGRPAGLRGRTRAGEEVEVHAQVVVGADGRGSPVARMAGIPGRVLPHGRFGYFAYYEDLPVDTEDGRSILWMRGRDVFYAFPNDDGTTIMAMFLHKDRAPEFRGHDKEEVFVRCFDGLPRRPPIEQARRVSPLIGKLDMPNVRRPAARSGVAFVGDAAQASDPLWGVGVGFALQSAEWLADELAGPILAGGDVDAALERYRRQHRRFLAGHHMMMSDYASGRPLNGFERRLYRAAVRDPETARLMAEVGGRGAPIQAVMRPRRVARALVAGGRR